MRKVIFFSLFFSILWLSGTLVAYAATVNKTVDRSYHVEDTKVSVTESAEIKITDSRFFIPAGSEETFIIFNPLASDGQADEKIEQTLPTIKIRDGSGRTLNHRSELDGQHILVKVPFPQDLRAGRSLKLVLTYDSFALSSKTGAVRDIFLPSFAKDYKFETNNTAVRFNTRLSIPKSFGDFNFVSPEKAANSEGDRWVLTFSQEELTGEVAWIQMGTKQYYDFDIEQPYVATTSLPFVFNRYTVTLPRDILSGPLKQTVHFNTISPEPESTKLDADGNLLATFRVPANQSGSIHVKGYIVVEDLKSPAINDGGKLGDIPESYAQYLRGADYWEVDASPIQKQAAELKGSEDDIYTILTNTYDYVVGQIDYSEVKRFGINERQGALRTLQGGAAVCMEYSDLFITLLRAQGVPARAAFGYGYDPRSTDGLDTAHQWAEVYMPKLDSWILVDTTWGESGFNVIGGDLNHFYKYVASESPLTPAPVEARYVGDIGRIKAEIFTINALEAPPEGSDTFTGQADILSKYPENAIAGWYTDVLSIPLAAASAFDRRFTEGVGLIGLPSEAVNVLRVVTYSLPVVLIILMLMRRRTAAHKRLATQSLST